VDNPAAEQSFQRLPTTDVNQIMVAKQNGNVTSEAAT
jgi:hypothetical protein